MSKSKNKGGKPAQNNKEVSKKTDVNDVKEVDEKISEETAEAAETEVTEAAEAVADEVKSVKEDAPAKEEISGKADEAEKEDKTEEKKEKKSGSSSKKKPMSKKAKEREANAKFRALPFTEKCRKDPVIPVCIALVFVAIIVAAIYFIVPNAVTPSMGMTLDEFETRFNQAEVAQSLLNSGLDFRYGNVPYVDPAAEPSILGDQELLKGDKNYVDFFAGPSKSTINSGIEGATRKNDGELSYVRVYIEYGDDFNPVWMLMSNTIQTLYPEIAMHDAMDLAMIKLGEYNGDTRYYVKGDYGFRIVPVKKGEITYIVIDIVPRKTVDASQIREDLDAATPSVPAVTEAVATTAAST